MLKRLKILALGLSILPFLGSGAIAASNDPLNTACQTNAQTRASAVCKQSGGQGTTNPIAGPGGIISKAADLIALIASVAAVIMIIAGGFGYVTSGGNTEATAKARQRITSAVIGLVIVSLAWAIVNFVINHVIG